MCTKQEKQFLKLERSAVFGLPFENIEIERCTWNGPFCILLSFFFSLLEPFAVCFRINPHYSFSICAMHRYTEYMVYLCDYIVEIVSHHLPGKQSLVIPRRTGSYRHTEIMHRTHTHGRMDGQKRTGKQRETEATTDKVRWSEEVDK